MRVRGRGVRRQRLGAGEGLQLQREQAALLHMVEQGGCGGCTRREKGARPGQAATLQAVEPGGRQLLRSLPSSRALSSPPNPQTHLKAQAAQALAVLLRHVPQQVLAPPKGRAPPGVAHAAGQRDAPLQVVHEAAGQAAAEVPPGRRTMAGRRAR